MMQKNQRLRLSCERLGSELEGVCLKEGMPVFVPGVLPGEEADVLCVKVQPRYAFGRLMGVLTPSPDRVDPPCPVYDRCGGCSGQHMRYEATLAAKRAQVFDCLTRIGGLPLRSEDVPPVLGAEHPWHCRNKTALPWAARRMRRFWASTAAAATRLCPLTIARWPWAGLRA